MALISCGGVMNTPSIFRCVRAITSFRVMVICPTGRWKEDVSWCNLSENVAISPLSMMEYVQNISDDKPESHKTERI
jgi:hypothetical protein